MKPILHNSSIKFDEIWIPLVTKVNWFIQSGIVEIVLSQSYHLSTPQTSDPTHDLDVVCLLMCGQVGQTKSNKRWHQRWICQNEGESGFWENNMRIMSLDDDDGMLGCSSLWPLTTEQSAVSSRGGTLNKTLEGEAGGDILHWFPRKLKGCWILKKIRV